MEDPVDAFRFDNAVSIFGSQLQAALEGAKGKTAKAQEADRKRIFAKWIPDTKANPNKKFRDPAKAKV